MATTKQALGKISDYLGRPNAQKLLSIATTKLYGRVQYYLNLLDNSSNQNWLVAKCTLNATPDQESYNITSLAGDFARPILVETIDDADPYHRRREVDMVSLQDRDRIYEGRKKAHIGSGTFNKHSAVSITFYGLEEITALIQPTPSAQAQYQIFYEPVLNTETALGAKIKMIPNFDDLVVVHTSMLCLDDCEWGDLVVADNKVLTEQLHSNRRQERMATLQPEFDRLWAVFNDYRFNNKLEQGAQRRPYNSYRRGGRSTRWGY